MLGESVWEKGMKMDFSGNDEAFYAETLHWWARYFYIDNLLYWSKYNKSFMKINKLCRKGYKSRMGVQFLYVCQNIRNLPEIERTLVRVCVWGEGGGVVPPLLDPPMYEQMYYCRKHSHWGEKKLWNINQRWNMSLVPNMYVCHEENRNFGVGY